MAYGHVSQYVRVFSLSEISDEDLMCQTLEEIGPLTVAIDADGAKFRLYDSGIYYDDTCVQGDANHAVAVVGYGEEDNGEQYFIVRNSWGLSWGEAGYIRMLRNVNLCGIADEVYYPVI